LELDTITDYLAALPLSGPERKLLDLAATFRGSFPRSWLAELACATGTAIADEALARLSGQQLLLAQQDGAMIRVPVRLQRHLSEQPATEAVKQWHARAAELRRERGDFVESMWHLLQAGCYVQIADSIQGRINTLNISGLRALQEILGRVPDEGLTTVQRAWLYAGRGFCEIVCAPPGQIARVPADFARLQDLPEHRPRCCSGYPCIISPVIPNSPCITSIRSRSSSRLNIRKDGQPGCTKE